VDFTYNEEQIAFRDELRRWLAGKLPQGCGVTVF
jgi:hypothetical protein